MTLSECFAPNELLMKQNLIDKYFPKPVLSKAKEQSAVEDVDKVA